MIPKLMRHLKGEDQEQIGQEQKQKQKMKIKKKVMMTTNNQKRKKFEEEEDEKRRSQSHSSNTCTTTVNNDDDVTGLRIVTQIITNSSSSHIIKPNHNVVIKSALLTKPNTIYCINYNNNNNTRSSLELCFLKACTLCNKNLSHDKDIYMYRGDQGFCSIECRNRQIVMDEMKELEEGYCHNYKQMISSSSSYRNKCWNDARLETRLILEELRLHRLQSNKPIPNNEYSPHHHQNHWTINVS